MAKKKRRRDIDDRDDAADADALWEWQVPLALLIVGFLTLLAVAFVDTKSEGPGRALIMIALYLVLYVPLTIAAMYVVASVLGISFGFLNTALLKLAGITLFTLSLNAIGDWIGLWLVGWLLAVAATYFLFSYCFYLDAMETIKAVVAISFVRGLLGLLVGVLLAAMAAGMGAGDALDLEP